MSNQLIILGTVIPQQHDLFNLKDLHQISGGKKTHEPYQFIRLDQTQELIKAIEAEGYTAVKTYRGTQGGTYACKEIVIAYAAWISPQFHLVVLRAFLNQLELQNSDQNRPLALPPATFTFELDEKAISELVWLWYSRHEMNWLLGHLIKPLEAIGSRYAPQVYGNHTEYKRHTKNTLDTLKQFIEPLKQANPKQWERLANRLN